MSASVLPGALRADVASDRTLLPTLPTGVIGSITPPTPATTKDAREVARYRVQNRHTQAGNGERLIRAHGETLRFHTDCEQWYRWDGSKWAEDDGTITRLMLGEVRKLADVDPQFVLQSETHPAKIGALHFAADMVLPNGSSVRVRERDLNQHVDLAPVRNGVIDLRAGRFLPPAPRLLFTKVLDVEYDDSATCPTWLRFMNDVAQGDQSLVRYLQVFFGHALSGRVDSQLMIWLHGDGGNGKGVIIRVLDRLFAQFAVTTPASTFAEQAESDSNRPSPELASFAGARLVTASETQAQLALDTAFIKWTTGGDKLKARFLNGNPFEFMPTHKTVISTNHEPVIKTLDEGMERRIRIIPLNAKFAASPGYTGPITPASFQSEDELFAELPGILNWLIEGAKAWYDAGADKLALPKAAPCEAVERESARYIETQDSMGAFLAGCTEDTRAVSPERDLMGQPVPGTGRAEGGSVKARDLYAAYLGWCDEQGMAPVHQNRFGRIITIKGFKLDHSNGGVRKGLKLNEEGTRLLVDGLDIMNRRKGRNS